MLCKDQSLNSLELDILSWQHLGQVEKARPVLGLIVVAILYLALQCCKLDTLLASARVSAVNDGITGLEGRRMGV